MGSGHTETEPTEVIVFVQNSYVAFHEVEPLVNPYHFNPGVGAVTINTAAAPREFCSYKMNTNLLLPFLSSYHIILECFLLDCQRNTFTHTINRSCNYIVYIGI